MSDPILEKQAKAYSDNYRQFGNTPQGLFWNNEETQYLRFERLLRNFDLKKKISIHDIGCGIADLHNYLLQNKIEHDYEGTEIVQEMIDSAKIKFPGIKIYNRNFLTDDSIGKKDILLVSGAFNLCKDIPFSIWLNYILDILKKMFTLSNFGIAFNFLTSHSTFTDKSLAYFNPAELFDFCAQNLSRFVILDHAYPLYEGTITVFHEGYLKSFHTETAFQKYFRK